VPEHSRALSITAAIVVAITVPLSCFYHAVQGTLRLTDSQPLPIHQALQFVVNHERGPLYCDSLRSLTIPELLCQSRQRVSDRGAQACWMWSSLSRILGKALLAARGYKNRDGYC
jgi:hypothetical protein